MARHESITEVFIAALNAGFEREAEAVKAAPNWPETQKRLITGTYPYLVALKRAEEGWSRGEIERELSIRTAFAKLASPVQVIGGVRIDQGEPEAK